MLTHLFTEQTDLMVWRSAPQLIRTVSAFEDHERDDADNRHREACDIGAIGAAYYLVASNYHVGHDRIEKFQFASSPVEHSRFRARGASVMAGCSEVARGARFGVALFRGIRFASVTAS